MSMQLLCATHLFHLIRIRARLLKLFEHAVIIFFTNIDDVSRGDRFLVCLRQEWGLLACEMEMRVTITT